MAKKPMKRTKRKTEGKSINQFCRRYDLLVNAQVHLNEAIHNISLAVEGMGRLQSEAEHYIIAHLENWKEGHNPHDSTTIPKLMEAIEKEYKGE